MTTAGAIEKALFEPMTVVSEITFLDPEGLAVIIDCIPRFVQPFFRPLRARLSRPQWAHLQALVLAFVLNHRRGKLVHLARVFPGETHRTSHGVFLARSEWAAPGLLDAQIGRILRQMKPREGEVLYLVIDDTRIAKRGRRMACVSKIWDHKSQTFIHGHMIVTAAVVFRGVTLPWRFELWVPRNQAGRGYRKMTEIAAGMIREFRPLPGLRVRVLFDAFYLCPTVTNACKDRAFTFFSIASSNRSLRRGGRKRCIRDIGPGLLKHQGRLVRMKRSRGWRRIHIASLDGYLTRIGEVRMVCSKRPGDPWKKMVAIVTDESGLDARSIVAVYERRWTIEVLFKELRGELGLGDYQVLKRGAITKHLYLCGLAHLLLTHRSMEALGAQARKAETNPPLPSLRDRIEALRRECRRDQVRRWLKGRRHQGLRKKLEQYLLAA